MNAYVNPATVAGPFGMYSHGCAVPRNARWLAIAGQIGADPAGNTPESIDEQCVFAFANLQAVLVAGGMAVGDLVKLSVFLLDRGSIAAYRAARQTALGDIKPPTTLIVVPGLANPIWKVEIEAWAARAEEAP